MRKIIAATCLAFWSASGFGATSVSADSSPFEVFVEIVHPDFDPKDYETRRRISTVDAMPHRADKLIGWIKIDFSRNEKIFPQKFTLYWDYKAGEAEEKVLAGGDLSRKSDEDLVFTTDGRKPISYYHVNKRIWTDKTGNYRFRVAYRYDGRDFVQEQSVTVNGE